MISNQQVEILMKYRRTYTLSKAASKAGMSIRTARKYLKEGKLPSSLKRPRTHRTRENPFEEVWSTVTSLLKESPGLQAKTIFHHLQRESPGKFQDGQLRTLQRHIKEWKALEGPPKEVYFPQSYTPGKVGAFDFTNMNELGITIAGVNFKHKLFHFVLPYSNWESASICFAESFESMSDGIQQALQKLGGVPETLRSDRLSAAVNNLSNRTEFTDRYNALLSHYSLKGSMTNPCSGHENGDTEKSHDLLKKEMEQRLLLRQSRDFGSRDEYDTFVQTIIDERNKNRRERFQADTTALKPLPTKALQAYKTFNVKVSSYSTIRVNKNSYSVNSKLIGSSVTVRLESEKLTVYLGTKQVEEIPRIYGENRYSVDYRHIIDSLVRKPMAFLNCAYQEELFPTTNFRIAYDTLRHSHTEREAVRIYTRILEMAAKQSESLVDMALCYLIDRDERISLEFIKEFIEKREADTMRIPEINLEAPDLSIYDSLLNETVAV